MADRTIRVRLDAHVAGLKQGLADARLESAKTAAQFDKDGKKIETASGRLVRSAQTNREAWTTAGTSLAAFGTVGVVAFTMATRAAIQWETAWTGVLKTVSGTIDELDELETELRDLTTTTAATHDQVAGVAEAAGQLGVATKDVAEFTRIMVMLGDTTNLAAEEAATSIAQLMNVMETAPDAVDNLGAAVVALGNDGASTERDIVLMAQRIAGAGKIIGLTEGEVLGLSNALASVGIEAEAGGSAVSNILIDIGKAVSSEGPKLERWAEVADMSAEAFTAAWKDDPAKALTSVIEGLGELNDAGGDVFSTLESLGQSDIRVTRALLSMAESGDLLADSLALGNEAWADNSALVAEAEKRYDTTAAKMQMAQNSIHDASITIGESLMPALAGMATALANVAKAFGALPEPMQQAVGGIGGIVSVAALAAGGFLLLAPRVIDTVNALKLLNATHPGVTSGLGKMAKAAGLAGAAMAAMAASSGIPKWGTESAEGVGQTTAALLELADGADIAGTSLATMFERGGVKDFFTGNDISSVAEAYGNLAKPSVGQGIDNVASSVFSLGQATSTSRTQSQEFFRSVDEGLTSLLTSGEKAKASNALAQIASEAGVSVEEVTALLPSYASALAEVDNQQQYTADSAGELAETNTLGAEALEAQAEAMAKWHDAVTNANSSFIDLNDAYQSVIDKNRELAQSTADATKSSEDAWSDYFDGTTASAQDFIKELQAQADAQREWQENLVDLNQRVATGLPESMREQGTAFVADLLEQGIDGAALVDTVTGSSDAQLEEIVRLWGEGGDDAAAEFQSKFDYWSPPVITPELNLAPAQATYYAWVSSLNTKPYVSSLSPIARADGGAVFGAGTATSDSIPALLSNGEHVLSAREVKGLGGHAMVEALRGWARGYADGGAVLPQAAPQVVTVPVSSSHTASAPVAIQNAYFNSPGDAGYAAMDRLGRKHGRR